MLPEAVAIVIAPTDQTRQVICRDFLCILFRVKFVKIALEVLQIYHLLVSYDADFCLVVVLVHPSTWFC